MNHKFLYSSERYEVESGGGIIFIEDNEERKVYTIKLVKDGTNIPVTIGHFRSGMKSHGPERTIATFKKLACKVETIGDKVKIYE